LWWSLCGDRHVGTLRRNWIFRCWAGECRICAPGAPRKLYHK
jgi:hypothetical protein